MLLFDIFLAFILDCFVFLFRLVLGLDVEFDCNRSLIIAFSYTLWKKYDRSIGF